MCFFKTRSIHRTNKLLGQICFSVIKALGSLYTVSITFEASLLLFRLHIRHFPKNLAFLQCNANNFCKKLSISTAFPALYTSNISPRQHNPLARPEHHITTHLFLHVRFSLLSLERFPHPKRHAAFVQSLISGDRHSYLVPDPEQQETSLRAVDGHLTDQLVCERKIRGLPVTLQPKEGRHRLQIYDKGRKPVATGEGSGAVPPNFVVPRKIFIEFVLNVTFPPEHVFCSPPNLKTWLRV